MQEPYQRKVRITVRSIPEDAEPPGFLSKVVAAVIGAVALVVAFMVSVVALAVVSVIIVAAVIYIWWKTRDLRRNLRENPPGGRVIDGDARREGD